MGSALREELMPIQVERIAGARRSLRVAVVTETYPPEVNGVAATPYRLNAVEAFIKGKARDKATADQAAEMAVEGATPLLHNAYKIPLMKALVKRAIRGDAEWTS